MVICYTLPRNYLALAELRDDFMGFPFTITAPLVDGAGLGDEARARGVVVLGHEGERLAVALSEMEPRQGSILLVGNRSRPDIMRVTQRRNKKVLGTLAGDTWRTVRISFRDFGRVEELVASEAAGAAGEGAPLFIYPFGPKSTVLAVALAAAKHYPKGSWFVYPVPSFYDQQYTVGIGLTYWLAPLEPMPLS